MKRIVVYFAVLSVIMLSLVAFVCRSNAMSLSEGCVEIPSLTDTYSSGDGSGLGNPFNANEVITAQISFVSGTTSATVRFYDANTGRTLAGPISGQGILTYRISATTDFQFIGVNVLSSDGPVQVTVTCGISSEITPFNDGRINREAQATVVAYCNSPETGDIEVYAIHESQGYFAFTATKEEIAAVAAKPPVNTLIKQALGAQLWRLTNGNLEIRRGADDNKVYSYQWSGC